jgi:uncharacterized protein YbjQ (UPF0145 family)
MIITTTPNIEGYEIIEYLGIISGDIDIVNEQDEIIKLAYEKNADAVVGVTTSAYVEVSDIVTTSSVHYITTGTAVRIRKKM